MRTFAIAFLVLGLSSALAVPPQAKAQNAAPAHWDYLGKYGALNWGRLDPAYRACSKGHEQSPIDIRDAHLNKSLKPIEFHFIGGPVTLVNDGHAIVVKVVPGSYIVANGVRYNLIDFSFHHPSEHAVNGDLSNMEVDFLTRSADGKMVMLGVLLSVNSDFPNPTLAMLWQHLPTQPGTEKKDEEDMVNPGGLFPANRGYWTYAGSLPHPPCTEGVQWYVFENPLSISREQLQSFVNLFPVNTRPLQELHGRRIEADE